jgi:hypothetical protein
MPLGGATRESAFRDTFRDHVAVIEGRIADLEGPLRVPRV